MKIHSIIFKEQLPKIEEEQDYTMRIPYALVMGSPMYMMIFMREIIQM